MTYREPVDDSHVAAYHYDYSIVNGEAYNYIAIPEGSREIYSLVEIWLDGNWSVWYSSGRSGLDEGIYTIYPQYQIENEADLDEDLIPDSIEEDIAEQFKPVLIESDDVTHPELQQGLSNFEYIINNYSNLKVTTVTGQTNTYYGVTNAHRWGGANWDSNGWTTTNPPGPTFYWLDLTLPDAHYGGPPGSTPLYYHVYRSGNYYYVQYWYWFNMNDIRLQTNNNTWHEGDWEHISIRLTRNTSTNVFTPDKINLYQHEGGHTKTASVHGKWVTNAENPNFLDTNNGYTTTYEHPLIVIASNAHASYFHGDLVYRVVIDAFGIIVFDDYKDEVDYILDENTEYFNYDYLEKLGETGDESPYSIHGYSYPTHAILPPGNSKEWLGFRGRCGQGWNNAVTGTGAPHVPSHGGISHEWKAFTENSSHNGFGNSNGTFHTITWVNP